MPRLSRMLKRIIGGVLITIFVSLASVYIVFLRQPPADDILAANKARRSPLHIRAPKPTGPSADDYYYYYYDEADPPTASRRKWNRFIESNSFVDIGQVYDRCDGGDKRLMIGRGTLIPDKVNGGVMTRTFINVTLDDDVTGGEMKVVSLYNGKELMNTVWELCSAEEGMPEPHLIVCPIRAGVHNAYKDLPIPSYLPKGRYTTTVSVFDQDGKELGCSLSDFTI